MKIPGEKPFLLKLTLIPVNGMSIAIFLSDDPQAEPKQGSLVSVSNVDTGLGPLHLDPSQFDPPTLTFTFVPEDEEDDDEQPSGDVHPLDPFRTLTSTEGNPRENPKNWSASYGFLL